MGELKIYIVVSDNDYLFAVKARSKQESLDAVIKEYGYAATEIASKELEAEIFQVLGKDCTVAIIN